MYQQLYNKRFQRNQHILSPPSHQINVNTQLANRQLLSPISKNCAQQSENSYQGSSLEIKGKNILNLLIQMQIALEAQRNERLEDKTKIIKMIKETQCKHSSIIYDSQIRYCKSPIKFQLFNNINKYQLSQKQHKKVSPSNFYTEKRIKQDQPTPQYTAYTKYEQNPQKMLKSLQDIGNFVTKTQLSSLLESKFMAFKQENITKLKQNFNEINKLISKTNKQLENQHKYNIQTNAAIGNIIADVTSLKNKKQNYFDNFYKEQTAQIQKIKYQLQNNIFQHNNNITVKIQQSNKKQFQKIANIQQNNIQKLKIEIENNLKNNVLHYNNKLIAIQNTFLNFSDSFKSQLIKITQQIQKQSNDILKINSLSQFNHNIYSNKIKQIFEFMREKFETQKKKQQQIENNKIKQLQLQKKRDTQMDEKMGKKIQVLKIIFSKQLQRRFEKTEQQLLGSIEKHIVYIEGFIQKVAEKQNIIMKKYGLCPTSQNNTEVKQFAQTCSSQNGFSEQDSNQIRASDKEYIQNYQDRFQEVYKVMRDNYQFLANRNNQLESTMSGIIEAINDIVLKIKCNP